MAHAKVRQLATHLVDSGVGKGDRVAIGMRNYPEWLPAIEIAPPDDATILYTSGITGNPERSRQQARGRRGRRLTRRTNPIVAGR